MGLDMDDSGDPLAATAPAYLQEDFQSLVLVRLMYKLVNLVAQSELLRWINSDSSKSVDKARYQTLRQDLDTWETRTRATFQPVYALRRKALNNDLFEGEAWYSKFSRAVTMLLYHIARILLLIHQPPSLLLNMPSDPGSSTDLLHALREIERDIREHSAQIFSITNGMLKCGAVRVRALQPLYVAGRPLTEDHDCRRLIDMIRAIEDDVGADCEYRVDNLLTEWRISYDTLDLDNRPRHCEL